MVALTIWYSFQSRGSYSSKTWMLWIINHYFCFMACESDSLCYLCIPISDKATTISVEARNGLTVLYFIAVLVNKAAPLRGRCNVWNYLSRALKIKVTKLSFLVWKFAKEFYLCLSLSEKRGAEKIKQTFPCTTKNTFLSLHPLLKGSFFSKQQKLN